MKLSQSKVLALIIFLMSLPATASTEPPKLGCWIVLSSGNFNNFISPLPGDTISLDLKSPESIDFNFNRPDGRHSYIPMVHSHLTFERDIANGSHDNGGWRFSSVSNDDSGPRTKFVVDVLNPFHSQNYSTWISIQTKESGQVGYVALECVEMTTIK